MTKRLEIYRCFICGNMVELLHEGTGQLVCCGQPMKLFFGETADPALETHVPVFEKVPGGLKIRVGRTEHPMEEEHHIEWIPAMRYIGSF